MSVRAFKKVAALASAPSSWQVTVGGTALPGESDGCGYVMFSLLDAYQQSAVIDAMGGSVLVNKIQIRKAVETVELKSTTNVPFKYRLYYVCRRPNNIDSAGKSGDPLTCIKQGPSNQDNGYVYFDAFSTLFDNPFFVANYKILKVKNGVMQPTQIKTLKLKRKAPYSLTTQAITGDNGSDYTPGLTYGIIMQYHGPPVHAPNTNTRIVALQQCTFDWVQNVRVTMTEIEDPKGTVTYAGTMLSRQNYETIVNDTYTAAVPTNDYVISPT